MEKILHMTLLGSMATLIIMLVSRGLNTWLKSTWKYLLWLVVMIRFLVPVMPASSLSLFNYIGSTQGAQQTQKSDREKESNAIIKNALIDIDIENENLEEIAKQNKGYNPSIELLQGMNKSKSVGMIGLSLMWMSVSICIGTYFILMSTKLRRGIKKFNSITDTTTIASIAHYKEILKIKNNIKVVYGKSPSLVGLIKPTIILPRGYDAEELKSIILHELIHYKYKDHWIGLLQLVMLTIHWFNPITWLVVREMNRDAEFACDERVLSIITNKKLYMEILVKIATEKVSNRCFVIGMESSKKQLRGRINKMINPVKNKKIISVIIAIILVGLSAALLTNKEEHAFQDDINILVLGHAGNQQVADTLMLVKINNKLGEVEITSIPRDTKVQIDETSSLSQIEGLTSCKLGEVLAYSSMLESSVIPEEVCVEQIEQLLDEEISYYMNVSSSVFVDAVNKLGGITVEVPQNMYFEDSSQKLLIDLKQGEQILNGEQLEMFARFRALPKGDLDRIENQQYIVESIMENVKEKGIRAKELINLVKDIKGQITTNIQIKDLTQYVRLMDRITVENIKFTTAQGKMKNENGMRYYILE